MLVTKHGKPAAIMYPLRNPKDVPIELRRKLYLALTDEIAKQLATREVSDEQIERTESMNTPAVFHKLAAFFPDEMKTMSHWRRSH